MSQPGEAPFPRTKTVLVSSSSNISPRLPDLEQSMSCGLWGLVLVHGPPQLRNDKRLELLVIAAILISCICPREPFYERWRGLA